MFGCAIAAIVATLVLIRRDELGVVGETPLVAA